MSSRAATPTKLDAAGLKAMVEAAARAVERNQAEINALNVFPVPDGDTGTNMTLTLGSVVQSASRANSASAGELADAMAGAALLGARGNSGLILAQYFTGIATAMKGRKTLGGREFATGLRAATDAAYRAVDDPVEGTMLTVLRRSAEAAEARCNDSSAFPDVLTTVADAARATVAETPGMLDVLARAGVVDSGGHGLYVMFAGALSSLRGESNGAIELRAPTVAGAESGQQLKAFLKAAAETTFGYCTSFVIDGSRLDIAAVRDRASTMGESAVVAGDANQLKVHVHLPDPDPILSYARNLGTLSEIEVRDMDEQTRAHARAAAANLSSPRTDATGELSSLWAGPERRPARTSSPRYTPSTPQLTVVVVAVAVGGGMQRIFAESGMGASAVVHGGDTMNPSVGQLADAVDAASARHVIILPNSKNVIGTARQVDGLATATVAVVPTETMQEGVAAILAFSPDLDLAANMAAMTDAIRQVTTAAVTTATRHFQLNGRDVKVGDVIGMLKDEVVAAGDSPNEVALALLGYPGVDGDLVTIYAGAAVDPSESEQLADAIAALGRTWELDIIDGGQPHYPYLISIE